jgi:ferric-dicitrate binding protein FerR (iron transport regulator)
VQLQRAPADGAASAARAGPLRDGDTVQTGAGAGATLRLPDGRSVEVGPEARLRVRARSGSIELEVLQGVVISRTPAADAPPLRLRTAEGLTQLGGAGVVQVAAEPGGTRVEVRLGEVQLIGPTGTPTRAAAGDVLRVTAGRVQVLSRAPRVVTLAPLRVTVRAGGAGVQLRRQGETRWRRLSAKGEALAPGDGVRTAAAPAQLTLPEGGPALLLQGLSELTFESAGQDAEGALDEARVALLRGTLALQLAPGRTGRLVLPELTVESSSGGGLSFERGAEGLTVAARAGEATLLRGSERQSLRAGERARVPGAAAAPLEVEALPRAPVSLPAGEPVQLFHPGLPEVTLAWTGEVPPEGVRVEVASDAAFTQPVLAGQVYAPFVNVPAPARGSLYWRVTAADGARLARGSVRLAPEPQRRPLERLRNEVPEGTERTTIFYQDRPPGVTFTWAPAAGAAQYRLTVYRPGALDAPVVDRTTQASRLALEAGALDEGRYVWSASPLSGAGVPLRGGRMNKLELVYDNSVPTLMVSAPRNGERAGSGRVRVAGVAPVGSTLWVNGQRLALDEKGRFDARVVPTGQPPLVQLMMTRPGAPTVLTVRRLR